MSNRAHNHGFHKGYVKSSAELCAQHTTPQFSSPPSRKQLFLLFNAYLSIDGFQDQAGGDLGKLFGLDFVEASAVDAAFRNQLGGLANRFFTVPFGVGSGPCCHGRW
jgi:hypothetical protein